MDRKFVHTSSLAKKFFEDYEDVEVMPLTELPQADQEVYQEHVVPLMEAHGAGLDACRAQADRLRDALLAQPEGTDRQALYESVRRVADWVQSSLALVLCDAAAHAASADGQPFYTSLQAAAPALYRVRVRTLWH